MRSQCLMAAAALAAYFPPKGAHADKFEDLSSRAVHLASTADVAGLFWTATVDCSRSGDDLGRRQCEGIREARAEAAAGRTYRSPGDAFALSVGSWDPAKGGLPISARGCIACAAPIEVGGAVGGEKRYVTTRGAVAVKGGALQGPEIHKALRKFESETAAQKWRETAVPRLRSELLFKVPAKPTSWGERGAMGFAVELVGVRVVDPCDGAVILADPPADASKPEPGVCGNARNPERPEPAEPKPDAKPPQSPALPEMLSSAQVGQAMSKAKEKVNVCFGTYGVPGKADLAIEIGGDGKVRKVELRGEFEDTPTGSCIVEAVTATEFPPFRKSSVTINFPFILR